MKDLIKKILIEESEKKDLIVPYKIEERIKRHKRIVYKKIQEYIKNGSVGSLNLHGAPIESLPSNLNKVNRGALYLEGSKILELPPNLTVDGTLNLNYTPIRSIPEGLSVGYDLWLINTPLGKKYTAIEIKDKIIELGGHVGGTIITEPR